MSILHSMVSGGSHPLSPVWHPAFITGLRDPTTHSDDMIFWVHRFTHILGLSQHIRLIFPLGPKQKVCVMMRAWGHSLRQVAPHCHGIVIFLKKLSNAFSCLLVCFFPQETSHPGCTFGYGCFMVWSIKWLEEDVKRRLPVWRWHTQQWAEQHWTTSWQTGRSASALGHGCRSPAAPLISGRRDGRKRWREEGKI